MTKNPANVAQASTNDASPCMNAQIVRTVKLDALVLMQMLQHCKDTTLESVTGQLLGIDMTEKSGSHVDLYVSFSFPLPHRHEHHHQHRQDHETTEEASTYQMDMLRCLRDVHIDHQIVGWYSVVGGSDNKSCSSALMMNHALMETQCGYQQMLPFSILLLLDEQAARLHMPCVRAYRLTEGGMAACLDAKRLTDKMFCTVPIEVTVSILTKTLISSWPLPPFASPYTPSLVGPLLCSKMECLLSALDAHAIETSKFQHYQKAIQRYQQMLHHASVARKAENEQRQKRGEALLTEEEATSHLRPPFEPSRLDDALWQHQLITLSEQLITLSEIGLKRLSDYHQ